MEILAGNDALLHPDRQMQIHHWKERMSDDIEQQEQGVNSRLFQSCQDALQCLIRHLDTNLVPTREHNTLRRCSTSLQLWSDGYGVTTGVLDNILDRSKSLRLTTLSILNPMCEALSQGLRTHSLSTNYDTTAAMICISASELCSQTRWLLVDHEEDASDSDSESSNSDDDANTNIHDLIQRVKMYTDSLIDLGTALDCPALEPESKDKPNPVTLEQRSAQDYHTELIKNKFPQSERSNLVQRVKMDTDSLIDLRTALDHPVQPTCWSEITLSPWNSPSIPHTLATDAVHYADPGPHSNVSRDSDVPDFIMDLGVPGTTAQRTYLPNEPLHNFAPMPLEAEFPDWWLRENPDGAQMVNSRPRSPPAFATNASGEKSRPTGRSGEDSQPPILDFATEDDLEYTDRELNFY